MRAAASPQVRAEALRLIVAGCSAREAARRVGFSNRSVSTWASLAGMVLKTKTEVGGLAQPWPPLPPGTAEDGEPGSFRLTVAERMMISCRLVDGWSLRAIAAGLRRAPSTVSREIARGSRCGRYDPGWAHKRAERLRARPRPVKLDLPGDGPSGDGPSGDGPSGDGPSGDGPSGSGVRSGGLRGLVVAGLNQRHSPQQIAARLRRDFPDRHDLRVSHETIYQALYVQGRGSLRHELTVAKAIRSGRTRRRPVSKLPARAGKPWLDGAHLSQRPPEAEDRAVPGHWEGDLVIGGNSRSALITLVERASRYCLIARLPDLRTSPLVVDHLTAMIGRLPVDLRRSLTWDQGSEMAQHARFSIATDCRVFFCDPHSPWQRGSNENLNGLIRDYYPKGTDFAQVSDAEIQTMQHQLNTRPRMTLDWMTPTEKLDQLLTVAMTT